MSRPHRRAPMLVILLVVFASCSSEYDDPPDYSAGGGYLSLTLREPKTLGTDFPDSLLFQLPTDARMGLNGELYIIDARASRIVIFSREQVFRRAFGAPGVGPGQLVSPSFVGGVEDEVVVFDNGNRYIYRYDLSGSLMNASRCADCPSSTESLIETSTGFVLVTKGLVPLGDELVGQYLAIQQEGALQADPEIRTIAAPRSLRVRAKSGGTRYVSAFFFGEPVILPSSNGGILLVSGMGQEICEYDGNLRHVKTKGPKLPGPPIGEEERALAVEHMLAVSSGQVSASYLREHLTARRPAAWYDAQIDEEGSLWLFSYSKPLEMLSPGAQDLIVHKLNSEFEYVGSLRIPTPHGRFTRGRFISFDYMEPEGPTVVVYRIAELAASNR